MIKWETLKLTKTNKPLKIALFNIFLATILWLIPMLFVGSIKTENSAGWHLSVPARWIFGILGTFFSGTYILDYFKSIGNYIRYEVEFDLERTGLNCLMLRGPYVNQHSGLDILSKTNFKDIDVPLSTGLVYRGLDYKNGKYYLIGIGKFEDFKKYEDKGILQKVLEEELEDELSTERMADRARKRDITESHRDRYLEEVEAKFRPEGSSFPYGNSYMSAKNSENINVQDFVNKVNRKSKKSNN